MTNRQPLDHQSSTLGFVQSIDEVGLSFDFSYELVARGEEKRGVKKKER
jgi:hypothetical protein